MEYVLVTLPSGHEVYGPASRQDDEVWQEGAEALVSVALRHYNEALQAQEERDIPRALQEAQRALRYFPYSPLVLELCILLALQHGGFSLARHVIDHCSALGIDALADYSSELEKRVAQWNKHVQNPHLLRQKYSHEGSEPSYRELALLQEHFDSGVSPEERQYMDDYGSDVSAHKSKANDEQKELAGSSLGQNRILVADERTYLFSGIIIVLLALVGMLLISDDPPEEVVTAGPPQGSEPPNEHVAELEEAQQTLSAFANLTEALVGDERAAEVFHLFESGDIQEQFGEEGSDRLTQYLAERVYAESSQDWYDEEYEDVYDALYLIRDQEISQRVEKHYRLGLAAHYTGRDSVSIAHLKRSLDTAEHQSPYFEAQAAYSLAISLEPEQAVPYARLIAEKYSDTAFYNSHIRQIDQ